MKKELIGGTIGTIFSVVGTTLQTNELLEMISLIITIIGALISFIIVPLVNWHKQAKADNKITHDEVEEGLKIITTGFDEMQDKTKKKGK